MKMFLKKLIRSSLCQRFLAHVLSLYIKFVFWTNKWEYIGTEHLEHYIHQNKPFLACFWHGRLAMMVKLWKWDKPFAMLSSAHRDGLFISQTISYFGIDAIHGSTRRSGAQAARSVLNCLQQGIPVGITPDGPRGPRQIAGVGIVTLAKLGSVDIVPTSYATTRRRILKTWDRLHLPLPFGRGVFYCGKPISCSEQDDLEQVRQAVENSLNEALMQAERHCGHSDTFKISK